MFWHDFFTGIKFAAILGVLSHVFGEVFPRRFMHYDMFPFAPMRWEKNGHIYRRLHVSKWAAKLPDMSRIIPYMYKKKITDDMSSDALLRFTRETCVAELTHMVLIFLSPILTIICESGWGVLFMFIYAFCNVPFVLIQRYNRPMLVKLYHRSMKKKEESSKEIEEVESFDTVM